jgi:hypothetical protein
MAIKKVGSEYKEVTPIVPVPINEKHFCNVCGEALTEIISSNKSSIEKIFNCEKCKIIVIK